VWGEAEDAALLVRVASREGGDVGYACGRSLSRLAEREHVAVQYALDEVSLDGPAGAPLVTLLATLGGPTSVVRLHAALSAHDPATRQAAIHALALLPDPRVAELIAFALADESVDVQMRAAQALGGLRDSDGKPQGRDSLLLALSSPSDGVRASAARSLGNVGDQRSIAPLRELVADGSPGVVMAAIEALRALRDAEIGRLLTDALAHDDEEVVKQALHAVADARAAGFVQLIVTGLSHRAWDVRRLSAELLGGLGDATVVPTLRAQHLREADEFARDAMALALRKLGVA
jgi:HEAT repeat protein